MNRKGQNIYIFLLYKMLLALGTLLACQALFLYFNRQLFHPADFGEWMGIVWGNLVFGAATVATFLSPYMLLMLLPLKCRRRKWYRAIAETLYILPLLIIVVARGANTAYFQFTYRLLSDEIFVYLGNSGPMDKLIPLFAVDYWYAVVFPIAIIVLALIINHRIKLSSFNPNTYYLPNDLVGFGFGLVLVWFLGRGGFGHFIRTEDAAHFCQPKHTALVSNDAYNILRSALKPNISEYDGISDQEAETLFNPVFTPLAAQHTDLPADTLHRPNRNVVLIIVESLGQEYMGCYNPGGPSRTPFLDSLARRSTLYQGRSCGKKSIEGITTLLTSVPTLMSIPFVNSNYKGDQLAGIPTVLKRHGYRCGFFHGSHNGVMDFDRVAKEIGFDEYHGLNEYNADSKSRPEDFDGVWGIYDEPMLQYMLRKMTAWQEPFLATAFTVTSHHPYPIPDKYKGRFDESGHPLLKCVQYTDHALRRFFEEARKQSWYENTLFIITGDHSGQGLSPEYNDYDGWYRIPMIVYDPKNEQGEVSDLVMQQTDLLPSLIDWLGFDDRMVCFGQSVAQNPRQGWNVYYGNGFYCMVSNNANDPKRHDITVLEGDTEIGSPDNLRRLKAVLRQYSRRLIHDQLTTK